jgi:hypothetical protein
MNAFLKRKSPKNMAAKINAPMTSIDAGYNGLQRTMPTSHGVKYEGQRKTLG